MDHLETSDNAVAVLRRELLAAIGRAQDAQAALDHEVARIRVSLPEYVAHIESRADVVRLRAMYEEAVAVAASCGRPPA